GFSGTVAGGRIRVGDPVRVLPADRTAVVARIVTYDADLAVAEAGDAITLVLDREVDVSRGDTIVGDINPPQVADRIHADLAWMD
ncbi:sulfate adenylyltransferase subunit CysN, partial [Acinetobacter baumannii]